MLTIKTPERYDCGGALVFLMLTLDIFHIFSTVCIFEFEQVNVS